MENSTRDRFKKLVIDELFIDDESKIKDDARFVEDLGADSLDCVEMIINAEEEFGICIPEDDATKLVTFGDAVAYVEKRLQEKAKSQS